MTCSPKTGSPSFSVQHMWATLSLVSYNQGMYSSKKLSMTLLPKVPGLQLENLAIDAKTVSLSVASSRPSASCPVCGQKTARLHTHYPVAPWRIYPGAAAR